jgi:hypothetical protein
MPRPSHFLELITRTILGEKYRSLSSSLRSLLHSPVTSSLWGYFVVVHSINVGRVAQSV